MIRTDQITRVALTLHTSLTVAGLAAVAGAISFSQMAELAAEHGQTRWRAAAFPITVDGLELFASLYLLAQHRTRQPVGVLPWAALLIGTAASLAANVAIGGHDLIGRALAGWPAVSLLISIKLLFSMFDRRGDDRPVAVPDDQRATAHRPVAADESSDGAEGSTPSWTAPRCGTDDAGPSANGSATAPHLGDVTSEPMPARRDSSPEVRDVTDLVPAARAAHAALAAAGRALSRDALVSQMRADGHSVSNARASTLLKILKSEPAAAHPTSHGYKPRNRVSSRSGTLHSRAWMSARS